MTIEFPTRDCHTSLSPEPFDLQSGDRWLSDTGARGEQPVFSRLRKSNKLASPRVGQRVSHICALRWKCPRAQVTVLSVDGSVKARRLSLISAVVCLISGHGRRILSSDIESGSDFLQPFQTSSWRAKMTSSNLRIEGASR